MLVRVSWEEVGISRYSKAVNEDGPPYTHWLIAIVLNHSHPNWAARYCVWEEKIKEASEETYGT